MEISSPNINFSFTDDIMAEIFYFLHASDIFAVKLVCRKWRYLFGKVAKNQHKKWMERDGLESTYWIRYSGAYCDITYAINAALKFKEINKNYHTRWKEMSKYLFRSLTGCVKRELSCLRMNTGIRVGSVIGFPLGNLLVYKPYNITEDIRVKGTFPNKTIDIEEEQILVDEYLCMPCKVGLIVFPMKVTDLCFDSPHVEHHLRKYEYDDISREFVGIKFEMNVWDNAMHFLSRSMKPEWTDYPALSNNM
jgi:hypothetical protein